MDNEKNIGKRIGSTITRQYAQKTNRAFHWTIAFITFQFFIMAFLSPAHLRAAYTIHQGSDVEIQGDYAYVAVTGTSHSATDVIWMRPPPPELPSGLRVIDISDPDSPEIVGGLNYSNSGILCLKVDGDLAYLSYSGSAGVKIINISDPEDPEIIGTIKNVYAREMVIRDGYAYIADPDLGLVIYDVSDSASPVRTARLNLNGTVEDIAVQGDFAYLTFDDDDYPIECGIHVCNISDPENPSLVDRFVVGTGFDSDIPVSPQMKIWMNADYAYLAKRSAFIIVDVSDPENLSREEIWHLPGLPPHGHIPSTEKLDGSGEYICITGDVDDQELLFVVNISDPLDPDPLGKVSIYKPNGGVAVQGDYACIVGWDGFQIIDISDPNDPSVVGKIKSTSPSGTSGIIGVDIYGYPPYGYGYGSPYFPGYGPGYGYGYGYGYPYSGGFGASGGFGFGYPFGGFGASWRPLSPTSYNPSSYAGGIPPPEFFIDIRTPPDLDYFMPYGFGTSGGFGFGYPFGGFGASGGFGFGYPFSGFGSPYSGLYFGSPYPRFPL
ncbi:MAG: LVIVD repeat-containing protein [bacterium]